jgi:hypothetical protein
VFFGLTVGVVPVAVEVGPSVARVEFAVDGTKVAAVDGPPWSAPVDFGPAALPARLEARALDVEGGEVAREVALVNRPFPRDGAAFEILSDRAGYPRRVRLLWDAVLNAEPAWVRVALDGEILLDGIGTDVMLPAWDESRVHILTVEIERLDGGHDMAATAFGGELGCEPLWSLTPVVLQMREGGAEPEVELLEKVLTVAGDPSDVLAVRREPPRLWMVRDPEADRLASWSIYHLESNPLYWGRWATLQGMRGHRAPEGSVLRYVAPQSTGTPEAPQFMVGPGLDISDSAFVWFVGAEMEENFSDSTTINLAGAVIVAAREGRRRRRRPGRCCCRWSGSIATRPRTRRRKRWCARCGNLECRWRSGGSENRERGPGCGRPARMPVGPNGWLRCPIRCSIACVANAWCGCGESGSRETSRWRTTRRA